jgi:hypothetical protein
MDFSKMAPRTPHLSQDAAIVLALAGTSLPFARTEQAEAERWVRVLRLHGQVGHALQALGVGEAPLESEAEAPFPVDTDRGSYDAVDRVARQALHLARRRRGGTIGTVDILFALFEVYGKTIDRALYVRGTTRDELIERLLAQAGVLT